ncbi:PIN domain-containing protein [Calidifontimicrobium sp. SYSU G02091]|uniref:PIN domain-containing protein n=1 Tax=Calidifontimicrobium sp. SYSU G02091 TaxID=2926421 RepID=UPI001F53A4FD|nr:PIN domain-containing protein [Calidifontimicrobium sp. SYSU G02091]MCI1190880.1 PIN domain-containing protein [Calidifontimicrobium sp. SYSU G02091]
MPPPPPTATPATPVVVLDTNAVLDWLWFADRAIQPLAAAVTRGACRWLQTDAMRDELRHVLAHRLPPRAGADPATVEAACVRWAHRVETPPPSPLRCRDDDDQVFVDLALAARARWLVTRDRALLALRCRALAHGTEIVTPAAWAAATAARPA